MRVRPTIVVLAAGQGSRFLGTGHKLEQPLGDSAVLTRTLGHAIETGCPLLVVTTPALVPLATSMVARRDVVVLADDQAQRGIGHSIASAVGERPGASGWLILPGDMPLVRPASMLAVAAALEEHPVAYPQYRGRRGHPVGFAAELYSELISLDGDEGARRVLARFPATAVELDDPGILVDIDTESDLHAVRESSAEVALPGPPSAH